MAKGSETGMRMGGLRTEKGWSLATPDTGRVYIRTVERTAFTALCVPRVAI